MSVDLILGLQWGDEGKGKIVDFLTNSYEIIARFQGGPNAGHTLEFDGIKHVLHTIPSGIFHSKVENLIGNGVVIDPVIFKKEIENLNKFKIDLYSKLLISNKAHIILPTHRILDASSEISKGKSKIGSTLRGIGPTYMDKTGRNGIRVGDIFEKNWEIKYDLLCKKHINIINSYKKKIEFNLNEMNKEFFKAIETLKQFKVVNSQFYLSNAQKSGKKILAEGAQGTLLDIDFGTYPYVTSSTTTAAGACTGLGIAPKDINEVYGIFKAYTTRVGSGPFPTEINGEDGELMAKAGNEFGSTTGRARRCGWLDLVALKYAIQINGVTQLIMMKGDVLSGFKKIKICTSYDSEKKLADEFPFNLSENEIKPKYIEFPGWEKDISDINSENELPKEFISYMNFIEEELETPIKIISVGPDRKQTIFR
ncbi:MAG: adenylosuccinate synthase [Flavobacteriaceae bacterium]|nr:adenylosuccinate synthase [Flavobacteriaceae bacterium]